MIYMHYMLTGSDGPKGATGEKGDRGMQGDYTCTSIRV